jgi:DNA-binding NarL/FixJ family response regulator
MGVWKVLIIEDNDLIATALQEMLRECGEYSATHVSTLFATLDQLQHNTFDFILCDLGLPDSRGVKTVMEVKKHTSSPIIVLSGTDITSIVIATLSSITEGFILKQELTFDKFYAALRHIGKV